MQRLKTRSQFQAVMDSGTVARTVHFALHRGESGVSVVGPEGSAVAGHLSPGRSDSAVVSIGAMVPKRLAKRAVTRNAIKRQIYHVGSSFESAMVAADHVVRLRKSYDLTQFPSATSMMLKTVIRSELEQLFASAAVPSTDKLPRVLS